MPGFNIQGTGGELNALYEVGRAHRWRVSIIGGAPTIDRDVTLAALSVTRPSPEFEKITIHHKQNEVHLPGKSKWGPMDIVFYELITEQLSALTAQEIFSYWARQVIDLDNNQLVLGQFKRIINIDQIQGEGAGVTSWQCYGAWPMKVEPSELNYSSSELSTIKVTFSIDAHEEG